MLRQFFFRGLPILILILFGGGLPLDQVSAASEFGSGCVQFRDGQGCPVGSLRWGVRGCRSQATLEGQCRDNEVVNCAEARCDCVAGFIRCGNDCRRPTAPAACSLPGNRVGQTDQCGVCQPVGCASGFTQCGNECRLEDQAARQDCEAQGRLYTICAGCAGCAAGRTEITGQCLVVEPAYLNYDNIGELRVRNGLKLTGAAPGAGDLYLNDGKAIRVDGQGVTALNIGNWGQPNASGGVQVNVLGNLTIGNPDTPRNLSLFGTFEGRVAADGRGIVLESPNPQANGSATSPRLDLIAKRGLANGTTQARTFSIRATPGFDLEFLLDNVVRARMPDGTRLHFGVGSAALPAYSTLNDSDTGIYFPAADMLGLTTSGVERARLTNAGLTVQGQVNATGAFCINGDCKTRWSEVGGGIAQEADPLFNAWYNGEVPTLSRLTINGGLEVGGSITATGCVGPVLRRVSQESSVGQAGGYLGVNGRCGANMHVCTTSEVLQSINCGVFNQAQLRAQQEVWVSNGAPSLPTPTNDCLGWTTSSEQWRGIKWQYNALGGIFFAEACSAAHQFACCQ